MRSGVVTVLAVCALYPAAQIASDAQGNNYAGLLNGFCQLLLVIVARQQTFFALLLIKPVSTSTDGISGERRTQGWRVLVDVYVFRQCVATGYHTGRYIIPYTLGMTEL